VSTEPGGQTSCLARVCYAANATLVCVLSDIEFVVILSGKDICVAVQLIVVEERRQSHVPNVSSDLSGAVSPSTPK